MTEQKRHTVVRVPQVDIMPTYRKVTGSGNARYMCITGQLPKDWKMVEVTAVEPVNDVVILKVKRIA